MPKIRDEYDVEAAFAAIENELMSSMVRNMERHKVEEIGEEKEWEMWQALQLKSLDKYKRQNKEKYGTQFQDINKRIGNILIRMNEDGQMDQERKILKAIKNGADLTKASDAMSGRFFEINDRKMDALIKATTGEIRKAETAVLRKADDVYRKTIFNAQVYANSGAGTYEKAVDMATKDFIAAGLNCVEYKNGARHTLSDYADMAVRTAAKRAYLQGEGTKRQEWGIHTVIVNQRSDTGPGGVCPECLPFVGKVFIDDVWSGGKEGEKDEDGEELPLLSDAIGAGLYHPRCRDSHTTYFPGISTPPSGKITKKDVQEAVETEKEEARQQYAERLAEKYERLADTRLDPENKQQYEARAEEWMSKSDELTERRKRRLAERNKASEPKTSGIKFDDRISEQQRQLLNDLSSQYNTRLQRVEIGAGKAAGDTDVSGARIRLSDKHDSTTIHEFAHTLASTNADKFGLTQDQDFWKEIRKIRREYMKDVEGDPSRWISTYEHSSRSLDEFMAEAFTHAKMREMGLPIPSSYGKDFTYSQKVLDTVNKYFGNETGVAEYLVKSYEEGANITKERLNIAKVMGSVPKKVLDSVNEGTQIIVGKYTVSAYDYENDILHIAKGAGTDGISHEIGHLVDNKLIDKEKRDRLLEEAVRGVTVDDVQPDVYVDESGKEYRVLLVKSDKFISDYQGRIYVDTPSQAFDKNGNIQTERMLEFVSEMFREYLENPMNLAENHPEYYALIEEALK